MSVPDHLADLRYPASDGWGIADHAAAHDAIINPPHRLGRFFEASTHARLAAK